MADPVTVDKTTQQASDSYSSTAYSNNIRCGVCGSPVKHVPSMYEKVDIDWRCAKCLRRDKPDQAG